MPDRDRYTDELARLDAFDAATPHDNGCPHALTIDGTDTCSRASRTLIELARHKAALAGLIKALDPALARARQAAPDQMVAVMLRRTEAGELDDAIEHARAVLRR